MKTLNDLLADLIVFNYKVQVWHWNVRGDWGYQVHKQTAKLQAKTQTMLDAVAEKIRMKHDLPIPSLVEAVKTSSLYELTKAEYKPAEVSQHIIKDLTAIEQTMLAIKADHLVQPLFDEIFLFIDEQRYFFNLNLASKK